MKLQEIMKQGYALKAWTIKNDPRGERRVVFKLSKKTSRGEKFYVTHTPDTGEVNLACMEFTSPVLLKGE